jgi:hypothetical protein
MNDEFYIGWEDKGTVGVGSRVVAGFSCSRWLSLAWRALAQRTIGVSVFEWGKSKVLRHPKSQPYPHLLCRVPA